VRDVPNVQLDDVSRLCITLLSEVGPSESIVEYMHDYAPSMYDLFLWSGEVAALQLKGVIYNHRQLLEYYTFKRFTILISELIRQKLTDETDPKCLRLKIQCGKLKPGNLDDVAIRIYGEARHGVNFN